MFSVVKCPTAGLSSLSAKQATDHSSAITHCFVLTVLFTIILGHSFLLLNTISQLNQNNQFYIVFNSYNTLL